jgi:predicted  nucleic acid-binding Zn-ribbon protein
MIYSCLTNTELERLIYSDRTNIKALAELFYRRFAMTEEAEDAEKEHEQSIEDYEQRIDALQTETDNAEHTITERDNENDILQEENDALRARLAELTDATNLV